MRRLFAVLLAALMLCGSALAEGMIPFDDYVKALSDFTDELWSQDGAELLWVLEPEEGVTIGVCLEDGRVAALTAEFPCGDAPDAVWMALDALGCLDGEALEQIAEMAEDSEAELDGSRVLRLHGGQRDAFCVCAAEDAGNMLWQPIHGGSKLHDKPACSGMDAARMITEEAAEALGWEDCKKCRASGKSGA